MYMIGLIHDRECRVTVLCRRNKQNHLMRFLLVVYLCLRDEVLNIGLYSVRDAAPFLLS